MRVVEKQKARELRSQGYSINEIKTKLNLSKSSVSLWVRDIELTDGQKKLLSERGIQRELIERRRNTRLQNL